MFVPSRRDSSLSSSENFTRFAIKVSENEIIKNNHNVMSEKKILIVYSRLKKSSIYICSSFFFISSLICLFN